MSWIRPGVSLPAPAERTRRIPVNVPMLLLAIYAATGTLLGLLAMTAWNFAT